jgi:ssDNA-binding Zn-finger/Zn-ribbon topoisomerase 1
MSNDAVIFMCPPYPKYKEPQEDHSKSELWDCPKCKGKMWLSEKKKGQIMFSACANMEIILGCYPCIKKMSLDDFGIGSNTELIKLDL